MAESPFFVWKDSFNIGVERIDEQHRILFEVMNRLYVSMASGEPEPLVVNALNDLRFYAGQHFHDEEGILARAGFPAIETQRAQHGFFTAQLEAFDVRKPTARDALTFLKDWFLQHVLGTDRRFEEWLRRADERGPRPAVPAPSRGREP